MTSFRATLAFRMALGMVLLFLALGAASVVALRSILYRQLDGTLLHLAEVEAQAGAAATSSAFAFHEGVLLASREGPATALTRYAQLWTSGGAPLIRSRNLGSDLTLPPEALGAARRGHVGWATHEWGGQEIRSVVYPLELVGAAHGVHLLQVAAPTEPVRRTLSQFLLLLLGLSAAAAAAAYAVGWRLAGVALRPTLEITGHAEAIEAGTLSERITAHADVREFGRLVTVLNGMLDRLERAFDTQRRFTADASHELRAPLTVLRGEIEVALKRERSVAEYQATLERCREEVIRMARLVSDLLTLARSDAGVLVDERAEVDLGSVVQRVAARYGAVAAEQGVRIDVVESPATVFGDAGVLERVISNLVDNAVKHSPPRATITVAVVDGDPVTVTVADRGPGVSPEQLPHLFTRFFRGDPARSRQAESTGLGLAIARAGAEAHSGDLAYVGGASGAIFCLSLPRRGPSPSGAYLRDGIQ